jgi:acyl carrier protein
MSDTRRRIVNLVSDITQATPADVEEANQFTKLQEWDSLMHVYLVLGIEKEFGTQFDIEEVTTITSVDDVVALMAKKRPEASLWVGSSVPNGPMENAATPDRIELNKLAPKLRVGRRIPQGYTAGRTAK